MKAFPVVRISQPWPIKATKRNLSSVANICAVFIALESRSPSFGYAKENGRQLLIFALAPFLAQPKFGNR